MPHEVRFTANFNANLHSIRDFLAKQDAENSFQALASRLFEDVIPNLAIFPLIGRDFLTIKPLSEEGKARLKTLRKRAGKATGIREYITGDYLILYAVRARYVFLLAIRHHKQLSFDLKGHWA